MNKVTLIIAFVGYVSSARLDNLQYLPPQGNSIQEPEQPGYTGAKTGQQGGQYQPSLGTSAQGPAPGPLGPKGPSQQEYPQGPVVQFPMDHRRRGGLAVQGAQKYPGQPASGPQGPVVQFPMDHRRRGGLAVQGAQKYPGQPASGPQGPVVQFPTDYRAPGGRTVQEDQQYPGQQYPEQRTPLADVPILRLDTENPGDGTYRYAYETGNDIVAQEEGNAQSGWNRAQGSYRFVSPEGQNFEITYTADENGYNPQGAHLPTPPPIPDAILKSLEIIRQAEAAGNIIEGAYRPEGDEGQYHEGHDEGQYIQQQPSGGYQQPLQNEGQQRYLGQQGGHQQPTSSNGGYRY